MSKQENRELAGDFMHTNAEYVKLRSKRVDGVTPRETPAGQGPGGAGYDKPIFEEWTTDELRAQAETLAIDEADMLDRDALIDALDAHEATLRRR